MKGVEFPLFKTKLGGKQKFDLTDPKDRKKYFQLKAGLEIKKLNNYLKKKTFMAFLLGKKNAGKGTYAKLFIEALGTNRVAHLSVGDIVRNVHKDLKSPGKKKELVAYLKKRYRGFITIEKALEVFTGRDAATLLPTEFIIALVEREVDRLGSKAVFIDGFPRNMDQVSYSLYFRALMGYRHDPDFFVFIDLPEAIIDQRIKFRVICPKCQTPRSLKLLRTKEIGYDQKSKQFFLICDNVKCSPERMVPKEGDELGIEAIRDRVELDDKVMRSLLGLEGVPKILLRNSIPVTAAKKNSDDYEITPAYRYVLTAS
ncbi:MAG: nucleoside monophosphate kinase, partial [bacterium]|nr:nucleoside monophosphate kinase [bacterium]